MKDTIGGDVLDWPDWWYGFETSEFFAEVKKLFRFLVDQYSFVVVDEYSDRTHDFRSVTFQSGDLCISVNHEQLGAGVFVYLCSVGKRSGLDSSGLATFLDREGGKSFEGVDQIIAQGHFNPEFEEMSDDRAQIVAQLNWEAGLLRQYLDRIIALFQGDTLRRKESDWEEWKKQWRKATWERGMREIRERSRRRSAGGPNATPSSTEEQPD